LIEAVKLSRFDYARMLSHWINEVLPPDLDEIVFCGGTSEYMKPELRNQFSHYSLSWHAGIAVPKTLDPDGLGCRIADVYGLFSYFKSQFEVLRQRSVAATSQRAEDTTSTSGDAPLPTTDIQSVKECAEQSTKPKSEQSTKPKSEQSTKPKSEQPTHPKSEQPTLLKVEQFTHAKSEQSTEQKIEEPTEENTEDITEQNSEVCAQQKTDSSIQDSCLDDSNKWSDESSNTEPSLEESEANLDAALLLGGPYRGAGKKVRNYA
jgi:hypothetical protein